MACSEMAYTACSWGSEQVDLTVWILEITLWYLIHRPWPLPWNDLGISEALLGQVIDIIRRSIILCVYVHLHSAPEPLSLLFFRSCLLSKSFYILWNITRTQFYNTEHNEDSQNVGWENSPFKTSSNAGSASQDEYALNSSRNLGLVKSPSTQLLRNFSECGLRSTLPETLG